MDVFDDDFIAEANSQSQSQSTQSQPHTQTTQGSSFSDFSPILSGSSVDQVWGLLDVYRVGEKRLGVRNVVDYSLTKVGSFGMLPTEYKTA